MEYEVAQDTSRKMVWVVLMILICSTLPAVNISTSWSVGIAEVMTIAAESPLGATGMDITRQHSYLTESLSRMIESAAAQSIYHWDEGKGSTLPVLVKGELPGFLPTEQSLATYLLRSTSVQQVIGAVLEQFGQRYVMTLYTIKSGSVDIQLIYEKVVGPESFTHALKDAYRAVVAAVRAEPVSRLDLSQVLQISDGNINAILLQKVELDGIWYDPTDDRLTIICPGEHRIRLAFEGLRTVDLGFRSVGADQDLVITRQDLGELSVVSGGYLAITTEYLARVSISDEAEAKQLLFIPSLGSGHLTGAITTSVGEEDITSLFSLSHIAERLDGNRLTLDADRLMLQGSDGISTQGMIPFYRSLTRSVMLLAPGILSYGLMQENSSPLWQIGFGASCFALSVSVIDTILLVFDYYRSAE